MPLSPAGFARAGFRRTPPSRTPAARRTIRRILLRLYLYGYLHRVRSSRLLEAECQRNVEVLWLLGKLAPDHKTIADFRKDNRQALPGVTRQFTLLCHKLELFGGQLAGIDGTKLCAVNSKDANFNEKKLHELDRAGRRADRGVFASNSIRPTLPSPPPPTPPRRSWKPRSRRCGRSRTGTRNCGRNWTRTKSKSR